MAGLPSQKKWDKPRKRPPWQTIAPLDRGKRKQTSHSQTWLFSASQRLCAKMALFSRHNSQVGRHLDRQNEEDSRRVAENAVERRTRLDIDCCGSNSAEDLEQHV